MSHWNYRVFVDEHENGEQNYHIREVYYTTFLDEINDMSLSCTDEEAVPTGETLLELKQDLEYMQLALNKPTLQLVDNKIIEYK